MNNSSSLIFIVAIVILILLCIFLLYQENKALKQNKNLRLSLEKYRNELNDAINTEKSLICNQNRAIKYQNTISEFAQFTISCLNLEEIFEKTTIIFAKTLEVEFTQILELLPNGHTFLLKAGFGWQENLVGFMTMETVNNEAGYTLRQNQPLIMEDLWLETRFQLSPLLHNHKVMSGVSLTIKANENIYGILGVYSTQKRVFLDDEIEFIQQIININSVAIERNKEQETLFLLERAINSSTNGIIITDANYDHNPVIYTNSGFEKITGYSPEEILGKSCGFLQEDDIKQPSIEEIREGILEGREVQTVLRNYRKDGTLFWNQLYISPVYNSEQILTNFIGIQTDITEEIEAKLALKEKTEILEKFTENLKIINQIYLKPGHNVEDVLNEYLETACQILGMTMGIISEIIGDNYIIQNSYGQELSFLLIGMEYQLKDTLCLEVVKTKKTIGYNHISENKLLSEHSIFMNLKLESCLATPIWINGEIYGTLDIFSTTPKEEIRDYEYELIELIAQGVAKIINLEQVELQANYINIALQESQERLDSIFISLEDVVWSIHVDTLQLLYINPTAEKLYERDLSYFFHKRLSWLDTIHPSDIRWVKECYNNLLDVSLFSHNTNKGKQDIEYRILLSNGEEKYVRDRAHIIYNNEGKGIRIDGIITDITKEKKAQINLQKSEEQFRETFELAPIGMLITTLDGYIEKVNKALCESFKYTQQELIGKNSASLSHADDLNYDFILKQKILNREINEYEREKRFMAKDNSIVYTIVNVTSLKDYEGKPTHFIKQIVDISQRKKAEEQLLHNALHDKLTGLANRFLFLELLSQALSRCQRNKHELCAVLFLDLDQFKRTNDSLGHSFGDELLINISQKIKTCLHENDTLSRLGGDEFAILLDNIQSEEEGIKIAENILNVCSKPFTIKGYEIFTSVSIGIAFSSIGYDKSEDMLRDADLTMYKAKEKGRNCYCIFDKNMHSQLVKRVKIESLLRKAIENEEFVLYYQPIISFSTGKLFGFEALVRWINPELGFVSPGNFIPLSEETGLIIPLGEWILLEASRQAVIWEKMFPDFPLVISVNLSGKQLIEQNLLTRIDHILETTKVNPQYIKLEITESILMDNFDYAKKILTEIQNRNLKLSLDDFGTGYSSLSYLHRLPLNTLKIDRSFITPIEKNPEKSAIVKAIITLAHNLSLDVVAEGIETENQVDVLKDINCDYAQGYLFSKPVEVKEAEVFIKQKFFPLNK